LGLEVPVIASGGASVRAQDGGVIREAALPQGAARAVAEVCHRNGWGVTFATGDSMFFLAAEKPEWVGRTHRRVEFLERPADVPDAGVLSLIINGPEHAASLLELEAWGESVQAHRARTNDQATLTTITGADAHKGYGLRAVCEHFGIDPAHSVALGDSEVDLPMFAVAGLAVAMGNAHDAIRMQAHRVTATADEDGVAMVLESLMAGGE
jgi:hydroxymethylpyrimidine pyrophosphatase-like HAD family hydrolase